MIDAFDLASVLLLLLLSYVLWCVLLLYAVVYTALLLQRALAALARFLLPLLYRFCVAVYERWQTEPLPFATHAFGPPTYTDAQQLAFNYLVVLAHHRRQF